MSATQSLTVTGSADTSGLVGMIIVEYAYQATT